jgi:hypothetical protein
MLFSKAHHDNPENHQNNPNTMVDPCHRLRTAEPADMMRSNALLRGIDAKKHGKCQSDKQA